ncbi:MAG: Lon protease family protein [Armatimonadota bacterium]
MTDIRTLSPDELTHICNPDELGFESTADIAPIEGTVGQERAVTAVDFGLGIRTHGFNIYVAGKPGTGRNSSVLAHVSAKAKNEPAPGDWCYVNNFSEPYHPKAIGVASGKGPDLAEDLEEFIKVAREELPRAFESENYGKRKGEIMDSIQSKRESLLAELQKEAAEMGFTIEATPVGIASVPLTPEGRSFNRDEYDALPDAKKQEIKQRGQKLQESTNQFVSRSRGLEKEAQDKIRELDRDIALFAVGHLLEDLRAKYQACNGFGDCEAILNYLNEVENDVVEHLDDFRSQEKKLQPGVPAAFEELAESTYDRYKVNVFLTHRDHDGAPVVRENNPTYNNLLGKIEFKSRFGFVSTDHNMIKSGAIHRANGGYLVVQALDVLTNPFSWEGLKRVLRAQEAAPENLMDQYGLMSVATIKPEPIPLNIKVIMVGSPYIYYLLYYLDEEFRKFFKVKADFDIEMARDDKHVGQYAAFVADCCKDLKLKPFHRTAVAKIVDYGSRLIEDKSRLSTRFIEIADLASEASYWAEQTGNDLVMGEHVERALEQKEYRSRMIEDKIQSLIDEGVIMIDAADARVGQINGLSIYDLGDFSFGRPSRITARVAAGRGKIVDIQRESHMGGPIHSKGVMILTGYLEGTYATDKPIAAYATIAFEQLYDELEGDSASCAELYVLLSAIANIPIKQGIAVTGSMNQHGQVQPIGGVNRKIEGFFAVCKSKGLTGEQGVMIPASNVRHLMLKPEVIDAVRDDKFRIWPVENVDQGVEIITGVPAGEKKPDGTYPEATVHYMVNKRLQELAETAKEFAAPQLAASSADEKEPAASMQKKDSTTLAT